ncbi:MAG: hypothetical protein EGR13_00980, partial [Coprococcus comes]|nr:hypothetical protein [Coprococcus comes]
MQDCGNRGIEMWFCIGMYFFLGACAWMYFKKKSLFGKWDRLLRQIVFLMLAVTSLAFLSEIVQKTEARLGVCPAHRCIAGYSLAGL